MVERTEGLKYTKLLRLTQQNLKSCQFCPLMVTQPTVEWAPGTLLSQLNI